MIRLLAVLLFVPTAALAEGAPPCPEEAALRDRVTALEAELAKAKGLRQLKSTEGYQKARWGASKAEVKKLYPAAKEHDGSLALTNKVAGKNALTVFVFSENKLTVAGVVLTERYMNKNSHLADYAELKSLLTKKYGEPATDETSWSQDLYRGDAEHYGMAVSVGHLRLWSTWETEKTSIELSCFGENFDVTVRVRYASKELESLREGAAERQDLSDL